MRAARGGPHRILPPPLRVGVLLLLGGVASGRAQETAGPSLERVEAALDAGRIEEARTSLDAWFARAASPTRETLTRARYLRARLSLDADSAEIDYQWVAVEGRAPYGARARLRLAQLRLLRGEPARADRDLARLRADFPASSLVPTSWVWTGNAREVLGDLTGACEAWRKAAATAVEGDPRGARDAARTALAACDRPGERFVVQLGAFRGPEPADELARRAQGATRARVHVEAPGEADGWYRVRAGEFTTREAAARLAVRLREEGFEAIVVPAN